MTEFHKDAHRNTKIRFTILIISLILLLSLTTSYTNVFAENQPQTKTLVIAGDKNFPPYEYIDDDGEYRGFNVDLMRALAIELGVEIKFTPMEWMDAHVALQNGEIDAIQGMNFNDERSKIYDFSKEYLINSLVTFVSKDSSYIFNLEDLRGRRVAVQRSDSAAYILARLGEIEVVFFSDLNEAFDKLQAEEVDAVVGNRLAGLYIIQKNRIADDIKIVGEEINQTPYGIAVKKGNTEIIDKFNEGLESLKSKGTYEKIYEKWFGKEIKPQWKDLKYTLYFLIGVLAIALLVVYFFFRINNILKKEVAKRTQDLAKTNEELEAKKQIIEESNRFKEQIIDNLGNGLITFDINGVITTINNNCEGLIGLNREEALGTDYRSLKLWQFFNVNYIEDCLEKGKAYSLEESTFIRKDEKYVFSYTISPLLEENGLHNGAVLTFRDITEIQILRKKLTEQDKMRSLGRLITGISHEIRNPLTSIKTYIELLPIKYNNEKFREKITKQVPEEIQRLNTLLTDLLDYAKPKNLKRETFQIEEVIKQTVELLQTQLNEKQININYNINNTSYIKGDKQQIKQLIINLLLNSMEAMSEQGNIDFIISEKNNNIIVKIIDDGDGIIEEDLDKVFEPFYTTKSEGTGLGLAVCYQIVKENDGQIIISSKENKGTKVELRFRKAI